MPQCLARNSMFSYQVKTGHSVLTVSRMSTDFLSFAVDSIILVTGSLSLLLQDNVEEEAQNIR